MYEQIHNYYTYIISNPGKNESFIIFIQIISGQKHLDFWTTSLKLLTGKSEILRKPCPPGWINFGHFWGVHLWKIPEIEIAWCESSTQHLWTWVFSPRHSPASGEHIGRHRLPSTVGSDDSPTIKIDGSERETATATTQENMFFLFNQRESALCSLSLYNGICLWFKFQIIHQSDFLGFCSTPALLTSISYHLHMLSPGLRSSCSFPDDQ